MKTISVGKSIKGHWYAVIRLRTRWRTIKRGSQQEALADAYKLLEGEA